MLFEKTIFHKDNLNLSGTSINRLAVRGIIIRNSDILLVHLKTNNEFKFPGGGSNGNETIHDILKREILEETGGIVKIIKNKIMPRHTTFSDARRLVKRDSVEPNVSEQNVRMSTF